MSGFFHWTDVLGARLGWSMDQNFIPFRCQVIFRCVAIRRFLYRTLVSLNSVEFVKSEPCEKLDIQFIQLETKALHPLRQTPTTAWGSLHRIKYWEDASENFD